MNRVQFDPKRQGETKVYSVNFLSQFTSTTTTLSTCSVSVSVFSGTDANPSAMLSGVATVSGSVASQALTGGVIGVIYEVLFTATTSDSQTLQAAGYLAIPTDLC